MISASSEALSRPEPNLGGRASPAGRFLKKKRWLLPALLFLFALALTAGPSVILNILLKNLLPPESDLTLNYTRARAGFFFSSVSIEGAAIQNSSLMGNGPVLQIESIFLKGVSLANLIRLSRYQELPSAPLYLAKDVSAKNITLTTPGLKASLAEINISELLLAGVSSSALPVLFERFEAHNAGYSALLASGWQHFSLNRLDARKLNTDMLGSLRLTMLSHKYAPLDQEKINSELNLNDLTVGGLKLTALKQSIKNNKGLVPVWWLLSGCDTLELAHAILFLNQREAVNLKSAVYDLSSVSEDTTNYSRKLIFGINADSLEQAMPGQFWAELREITGDSFQGELNIEIEYDASLGLAIIKSACLELKESGRADISGRLAGVRAALAHYSPYQLLSGVGAWQVENLTIVYDDHGLAKKFYRRLGNTILSGLQGRSPEMKIMNYIINPLNYELEREGRLANLPAIYSEAEAFVYQPNHLRLSSTPATPLTLGFFNSAHILTLANIDKYDIIDKLCLTVGVNQRAPVFVAVKPKLRPKTIPVAPNRLHKGLDLPFAADGF